MNPLDPPAGKRPPVLELVACPRCGGALRAGSPERWDCAHCGYAVEVRQGKPFFSGEVDIVQPPEKIERGPNQGTPWRKANWRFLEELAASAGPGALVLDVGSGMGDFAEIFQQHFYYTLDVVAHPEVDIVCDLTRVVPFSEGVFDLVLVMNVVEHIYATRDFFQSLARLVKPGGKLAVAVPFLMKVHMAPYDFHRYTHYALAEIAKEAGLEVASLEGYYDPAFLIGESSHNVRYWGLARLSRARRLAARLALAAIDLSAAWLARLLPAGHMRPPQAEKNPSAVGYHLILQKPGSKS